MAAYGVARIASVSRRTAGQLHWPAVLAALLASALVAPLLLLLLLVGEGGFAMEWGRVEDVLVLMAVVAAVALLHAVLIGLPAFFGLRHAGRLSVWTLSAAGFVAGALLIWVVAWPWDGGTPGTSYSSGWHGRLVEMERDGIPTLYGWLSYLETVAVFGLVGIASALAFWFGWRYFQRQADARSRSGPRVHQQGDSRQ